MLKKPKILVLGSFVMDLIASTRRAPAAGETVMGLSFQTAPGGKGANQAVQCARLGVNVTMAGQVGADAFGREMTETAALAGVDVSHVGIDPNAASGVGHIVLEVFDHGVQNRITVLPGANFTLTVEDLAWLEDEIGSYDLLMLQFELPMPVIEWAAELACRAQVPVMLNPAPAMPMSDRLMRCVSYLSPNEHEVAALCGCAIAVDGGSVNLNDAKAAAKMLRERGVKNLIVTLGEHGAVFAGEDEFWHTPCVCMPKVADPTAAGDSFVASFCTGITAGLGREQAMAFAAHAAALTVSRTGAMPSLPTLEEVKELMREREYTGFDLSLLDALY